MGLCGRTFSNAEAVGPIPVTLSVAYALINGNYSALGEQLLSRGKNALQLLLSNTSTHTNHAARWFSLPSTHTRCSAALGRSASLVLVSNQLINQPGDTSDGLEIAGTDALQLNGASILRVSTSSSQSANLVIESGSSDGDDGGTLGLYEFSLRGGGDDAGVSTSTADSLPVVVDCSDTPVVLGVMATAFAGEYGVGQRIYFQVRQISHEGNIRTTRSGIRNHFPPSGSRSSSFRHA